MHRIVWTLTLLTTATLVLPDSGFAEDVSLTSQNTRIQFVGTHVGEKPDPRTGTFGEFTGKAVLSNGRLTGLSVDIDAKSLSTDIEKLTNHLKSPDFFAVNDHPQAKFVSTAIEPASDGKVKITGDLTLLGKTKSISFPATVSSNGGLKLKAEFTIDRTQWGMDYGVDRVHKAVAMTVTVGG